MAVRNFEAQNQGFPDCVLTYIYQLFHAQAVKGKTWTGQHLQKQSMVCEACRRRGSRLRIYKWVEHEFEHPSGRRP